MITVSQMIAKHLGEKDFREGVAYPNNIGIKLTHSATISLGHLRKEHLSNALKTSFSNTFLDTV